MGDKKEVVDYVGAQEGVAKRYKEEAEVNKQIENNRLVQTKNLSCSGFKAFRNRSCIKEGGVKCSHPLCNNCGNGEGEKK